MVTVRYGKKKAVFCIPIENLRSGKCTLKELVKHSLHLQLPASKLKIALIEGDKLILEEAAILKNLRADSILEVSVAPFDVGNLYECHGIELGSGSFSQVYKGIEKQTNRKVAIKVIDIGSLTSVMALDYHKREREILEKIASEPNANIIQLFKSVDVKEAEGDFVYFVLEFCEGGSLEEHIQKQPIPEEQARKIAIQLASALTYLEKRKIIHRDLKPQNILLSSRSLEEASVKLCDFGFSRYYEVSTKDEDSEDDENNMNNLITSFPNTPLYAPPEVFAQRPYDSKCDLWSVGAILFEILTGEPLFKVKSLAELQRAHGSNTSVVKIPTGLQLSKDCVDLLEGLLQRDPKNRISWRQFFEHRWLNPPRAQLDRFLLQIYSISSGEEYRVQITKDTDVKSLKEAIVDYSNIKLDDLMVLLDGGYILDQDQQNFQKSAWYLFQISEAQRAVKASHVTPQPIALQFSGIGESIPKIHPSEVPIKNLIQYFYEFQQLVTMQKAYVDACDRAYHEHRQILQSAVLQSKGFKAAVDVLMRTLSDLDPEAQFLKGEFSQKSPKTSKILKEFEDGFGKMANIRLHDTLRNNERKTLLDCVNVDKVGEDYKNFISIDENITKFVKKYEEFRKKNFPSLKFAPINSTKIAESFESLTRSNEHCRQTVITHQIFMKDSNKMEKELFNARTLLSNGTYVHKKDDEECFLEMLRNNRELLERTKHFYEEVNNSMTHIIDLKNNNYEQTMTAFVLNLEAMELLKSVRTQTNNLLIHQQLLENLRKMTSLPSAYEAYLAEISRRRQYQEEIIKKAEKITGHFQKAAEEEASQMKLFKSRISNYLSSDFFPGIDDELVSVVTVTPPGITALPVYPPASNTKKEVELLASEFDAILIDEKDPTEIRSENVKLRTELAEASRKLDDNSQSELLRQLQSLKEQLKEKNQLIDQYDQKFAVLTQKIQDSDDKIASYNVRSREMDEKLEEALKRRPESKNETKIEVKTKDEAPLNSKDECNLLLSALVKDILEKKGEKEEYAAKIVAMILESKMSKNELVQVMYSEMALKRIVEDALLALARVTKK